MKPDIEIRVADGRYSLVSRGIVAHVLAGDDWFFEPWAVGVAETVRALIAAGV